MNCQVCGENSGIDPQAIRIEAFLRMAIVHIMGMARGLHIGEQELDTLNGHIGQIKELAKFYEKRGAGA